MKPLEPQDTLKSPIFSTSWCSHQSQLGVPRGSQVPPGRVACSSAYNPDTWKVEAKGFGAQGHFGFHETLLKTPENKNSCRPSCLYFLSLPCLCFLSLPWLPFVSACSLRTRNPRGQGPGLFVMPCPQHSNPTKARTVPSTDTPPGMQGPDFVEEPQDGSLDPTIQKRPTVSGEPPQSHLVSFSHLEAMGRA